MVVFELYFIILIVPDDYPVYVISMPRCNFETKLACMSI
jgi:hypothetical protein